MLGMAALSDAPVSDERGAFYVSAAFQAFATVAASGTSTLDLLLRDPSRPLDYAVEISVWAVSDRIAA